MDSFLEMDTAGMVNIPDINTNGKLEVDAEDFSPPIKKLKIHIDNNVQEDRISLNDDDIEEDPESDGSNPLEEISDRVNGRIAPSESNVPPQKPPETFSTTPLNIPKIPELTETTSSTSESKQGGDDDVFSSLLEWKDGIASLPGSNLKFKMTEFGTLEIISTVETDKGEVEWSTETNHKASSSSSPTQVKTIQGEDSVFTDPKDLLKGPPPSGFCCCEVCGKYGLPEEFCASGRFCSLRCVGVHTGRQNKGREFVRHSKIVNGKFIKRKKKGKGKKLTIVKHQNQGKSVDDDDGVEPIKTKSPSGYGKKRGHILKTSSTSTNNIPQAELEHLKMADYSDNSFRWPEYLEKLGTVAAPNNAFKEIPLSEFPLGMIKEFKKDMKLEAVDPKHPSYICVCTVSEVKGTRLRLHFDGWSESYDFWTNSSSPFIFPVHWCSKNGQRLNPPRGQDKNRFNWEEYLKATNAHPAPEHLFQRLPGPPTHGFKVGMKLEAVDRQNPDLICVSTVTNVIGERFLVHFDEWDDTYDYWCEADCPYIHAVGWCEENGRRLTPPNDEEEDIFTWQEYLRATGAEAARPTMFKKKSLPLFKKGQKLESVDRRNPSLIRVATIASVQDYNIKIRFDGWDDLYDDFIDADSDDIHPVGWCEKTGHPLEPPLTQLEKDNTIACPTPGCKGIGHVKGAKYSTHHSTFGCPYSLQNLSKGSSLVDRLASNSMTEDSDWWSAAKKAASVKGVPKSKLSSSSDLKFDDYVPSSPIGSPSPIVEKFNLRQRHSVPSYSKTDFENLPRPIKPKPPPISDTSIMDSTVVKSSIISTRSSTRHLPAPSVKSEVGVQVEFEDKAIQHIAPYTIHFSPFIGINHGNYNTNGTNGHLSAKALEREKILKWSVGDVVAHVEGLGCPEQAKIFGEQSIDGEAFLLLNQSDIVNIMKIKLGPALKIYNSITSFLS